MTDRTADQDLAYNMQAMGDDLGRTYSALWQELAYINMVWQTYRGLFGHSPERLDLLNSVGRQFAYVVQQGLYRDVILGISRVTDPPGSGARQTLSITRLPILVTPNTDLRMHLSGAVGATLRTCEAIRAQRNAIFAHNDLAVATGSPSARDVPGLTRLDVEAALDALRKVLEVLAKHYFNQSLVFHMPVDVENVVYTLEAGRSVVREKLMSLSSSGVRMAADR